MTKIRSHASMNLRELTVEQKSPAKDLRVGLYIVCNDDPITSKRVSDCVSSSHQINDRCVMPRDTIESRNNEIEKSVF
jgi:hypothetical protein